MSSLLNYTYCFISELSLKLRVRGGFKSKLRLNYNDVFHSFSSYLYFFVMNIMKLFLVSSINNGCPFRQLCRPSKCKSTLTIFNLHLLD